MSKDVKEVNDQYEEDTRGQTLQSSTLQSTEYGQQTRNNKPTSIKLRLGDNKGSDKVLPPVEHIQMELIDNSERGSSNSNEHGEFQILETV